MPLKQIKLALLAALIASPVVSSPAFALSLKEALNHVYLNNPDINQQRAALRVTNETVPAALSGYRPSLNATLSGGASNADIRTFGGTIVNSQQAPRTAGVAVSQPVFDGLRARNNVNAAESNVLLGRQDLRSREQNVFLSVITAYMNVIRDESILNLRKKAVGVAERDVKMIKERFRLGDASRTDVGLVEAQLGLAKLNQATATNVLALSKSTFAQHVGKPAVGLTTPALNTKLIPNSQKAGQEIAVTQNPVVKAAQFGADVARYQVMVAQSALYPQLSLNASSNYGIETTSTAARTSSQAVTANLTIPIFALGGAGHTGIRSAKETEGQRLIQIDLARQTVKQALDAGWGLYDASKLALSASSDEVKGREQVVKGFREEYRVGQRILQNVLVEEVNLTNAKATYIIWQRERAVSYFSILAAMGKLNTDSLGINAQRYDENFHYDQVRDKWVGIRTPDGR